jgi:hypothetical protein
MSYDEPDKQPDTEAMMLDIVRSLREDPERYQSVRRALSQADTDEERVSTLLRFATSERELAALIPARPGGETELAWTTVTVTTVLIPDTAY